MPWRKPSTIRSLHAMTYRSRIVVGTTLLGSAQNSEGGVGFRQRWRWHDELNLRSIKSTIPVDDLRCKMTAPVREEAWTLVMAYNLIRAATAQAAANHDIADTP